MQSVDQLTQILTDAEQISIFRRDAAAALGDLGEVRAVPFLIGALEDLSELVRREAAQSLGKLKAPQAISPLLSVLARETDEETRRYIIDTLARIGSREAIPALAVMSTSESLLTRIKAQKSIRQILQRHPDSLAQDVEPDEPARKIAHASTQPAVTKRSYSTSAPVRPALSTGNSPDTEAVRKETVSNRSAIPALPAPVADLRDDQTQPAATQAAPATKPQRRRFRYGFYIILLLLLLGVVVVIGSFYFQWDRSFYDSIRLRLSNAFKNQFQIRNPVEEPSSHVTVYLKDGDAYFRRRDYENAIVQYEQALLIHPESLSKNIDLHRNLGFAYIQQGRYTLAAKAYERVIEQDANDAVTYNYLGNAYMQQGEYQLARKAYQRALEIQIDFAQAYNNLASSYVAASPKQLGEAEMLAWKAIQLEPNKAAYHDTLGWILYKQGRINKSIERLEKAIQLRQDFVKAHYHLALATYKANQQDRALQEIRIVFQLDPNFSDPLDSSASSALLELIRRMPGPK